MWSLIALLAAAGATTPDRTDLQAMFQAMDRDGNGFISASEAPRLTRIEASGSNRTTIRQTGNWIARYDANGDGRVSRLEFVNGAAAEVAAYRAGD